MSRIGLPDPKDTWAVAKDQRDRVLGKQGNLDDEAIQQYLGTHIQELYDPNQVKDIYADHRMVKKTSLGLAGTMVDQDVSVLHTQPFAKVLAVGGITAERHTSQTLELWLNTAIWQGAKGFPVWDKGVLDLRVQGWFWSKVLPAPQIIAGDMLEELVDDLNEMIEAGVDEKEIKEQNRRIDDWKRDHPAIVWRYVSPRETYRVHDDEGMSEVFEIRKLPYGAVVQMLEHLKLNVPGDLTKNKDVEVLDTANDRYVSTILPEGGGVLGLGKRDSMFLKEPWEHGLGVNPYVLIEGDPLPDNDEGWVHRGAAFHMRRLFPAMDEVASDLRTSFHAETVSPPMVKVNLEGRASQGIEEKTIDVNPNQTVTLYTGQGWEEEVGRFPTQQVNPDALRFLALGQGRANQAGLLRPALTGAMLSGQSAVGLNESHQIAQGELKIPHANLEKGFAAIADRFFRAVPALARDFPDQLAEVTVRMADQKNKSRKISVNAKDVRPYIGLVRGKIRLSIPINEGGQASIAAQLTNPQHPLVSDDTVREQQLGFEDPTSEGDKLAAQMAVQGLLPLIIQSLQRRAALTLEAAGPAGITQLAQQAEQLPAAAQGIIEQRGGLLETISRAGANRAQAGRGQGLSQLQGTNTSLPSG